MKLASLSLAAFLVITPSFAQIADQSDPKVETCTTPEKITAKAAAADQKFKLAIEGYKLAVFVKNTKIEADIDKGLFFENAEGGVTTFLGFKNGCMNGYGFFPSKSMPRLLEDAETL